MFCFPPRSIFCIYFVFFAAIQTFSCVDVIESTKIIPHVVAQPGVVTRLPAEKAHCQVVGMTMLLLLLAGIFRALPSSHPVMPGMGEGHEERRPRSLVESSSAMLVGEETGVEQGLDGSGAIAARSGAGATSVMSLAHCRVDDVDQIEETRFLLLQTQCFVFNVERRTW